MGLKYRNKGEMPHQARGVANLDQENLRRWRLCYDRDALGEMPLIWDYDDAEDEHWSPQMQALLEAQQRGEVALCAAFRAHPELSRVAASYPMHVDTMAGYIVDKMTADIRDLHGRDPLDMGSVKRLAWILARAWANGVLQRARL